MPDTLLVVPAAPAGSMESLENRMMEPACRRARVARSEADFSLIELLVAVAVMMIISGIVMQALLQMTTAQGMVANRTRMHASIRSATSLLQQEVGQAGRVSLPGAMTLTAALAATGAQTVTVTSVAGIFVNEQLVVDTGPSEETVTVTAVNAGGNTFSAVFANTHAANATVSVRGGFASGIVPTTMANGSTGTVLKIYGDINGDGNMMYVEYTCNTAAGILYRNSMPFTAAAKPVLTATHTLLNIRPNPGNAPCFTYDQDTVNGNTYVLVVGVTLTVATSAADPITHQFQTETLSLLNVSPRNVFDVWQLAGIGGANRIQPMPASVLSLLP